LAGFAEKRPKFITLEAAEIAKIGGRDLMVFDRGSASDIGCGTEVHFGADFEGAAVVAEIITGEAAAEDGSDLAVGFGVDTGDADEAGLHAG
jgi:hypothetical protein